MFSFVSRSINLFLLVLVMASLVACQTETPPTAVPTPPATATPNEPIPLPTLTQTVPPTAVPSGYFQQIIGLSNVQDAGGNFIEGQLEVRGITAEGQWGRRALPLGMAYPNNFDYALQTDRPLQVTNEGNGAGPSTMSAGTLQVADASMSNWETIATDVVNAQWHPNGRDLAYIAATADTYELRFQPAGGEARLLATDVPHTLSFSPDGRYIGFTRESRYEGLSGTPGIYVVEVETGVETMVSPEDRAGFGGLGSAYAPIWSPDSQSFVISVPYLDLPDGSVRENGLVWASVTGSPNRFWSFTELETAVQAVDRTLCITGESALINGADLVMLAGTCADPNSAGLGMGMVPATAVVRLMLDPTNGEATAVGITPLARISEAPILLIGWAQPSTSVWITTEQFVQELPIN